MLPWYQKHQKNKILASQRRCVYISADLRISAWKTKETYVRKYVEGRGSPSSKVAYTIWRQGFSLKTVRPGSFGLNAIWPVPFGLNAIWPVPLV